MLELLIVIALIGILLALILPAVQSARETARRTVCGNNVRQLAIAMQTHVGTYERFPSNGWGYLWIGDPDRGTDRRQPGGWIYNLLPSLDQQALRDLGQAQPDPQKRVGLTELTQTPLPVVVCPSRPGASVGPTRPTLLWRNSDWRDSVAKTDYAVNEGDYISDTREGPETLEEGDSGAYPWVDPTLPTGICFQRSEVRPRDVQDGLSQTYLLGEKYVSTLHYDTFDDWGYDGSLYSGVDVDLNRWVIDPPARDAQEIQERRFGSAHPGACHFAFCDGSVKTISYTIHYEVHLRLGNRKDGEVVDGSAF